MGILAFLKHWIPVLIFSLGNLLYGQARINISGDAWIVIDNDAFLVIDNPAPNALQTGAGGGNIRSEDENDLIRWNIGSNTGTYVIPWTTENNVKIPLGINLTTAGTGAGHFLLSTHTDNDAFNNWNNLDYRPSDVTNMGGQGIPNNSPNAIDRFWRIEHSAFTAPPQAILNFGYDDTERSNPGNTIPAGSMFAQRFSTTANQWLIPGSGTDNFPVFTVSGATVTGDFFKSWTLSHSLIPLPSGQLQLFATAEKDFTQLDYSVDLPEKAQQLTLQKSTENSEFATLESLQSEKSEQSGRTLDLKPVPGWNAYRLQALMPDGHILYSEVAKLYFDRLTGLYLGPNPSYGAAIMLNIRGFKDQTCRIDVFDVQGRKLWEQSNDIHSDREEISLDKSQNLAKGVYLVRVEIGGSSHHFRLLVN